MRKEPGWPGGRVRQAEKKGLGRLSLKTEDRAEIKRLRVCYRFLQQQLPGEEPEESGMLSQGMEGQGACCCQLLTVPS